MYICDLTKVNEMRYKYYCIYLLTAVKRKGHLIYHMEITLTLNLTLNFLLTIFRLNLSLEYQIINFDPYANDH